MSLHHVIYLSTPTAPLSMSALDSLLHHCRRHNKQHGITGLLLYGPTVFLQLLEGDEAALSALYQRLHDDPRHHSLIKLADKPILDRSCPTWTMAFGRLGTVAPEPEGFQPLSTLVPAQLGGTDSVLLETVRQQLLLAA